MSVVVLVPVGGDDPHRKRALSMVLEYYDYYFDLEVRVVEGADVNKGAAINAAVDVLPETATLILNDGDSFVPPHQLARAVVMAVERPGIVFAYTRYRRLTEEATHQVSSPHVVLGGVLPDGVEWEKLLGGSHGCIAIQRACWEQVGGLDPAFATNGYEDLAFNTVCEAFWPSRRVSGDLFHLWHPRGWDRDTAAEATNRALYDRYLERWGDREALLQLRHRMTIK